MLRQLILAAVSIIWIIYYKCNTIKKLSVIKCCATALIKPSARIWAKIIAAMIKVRDYIYYQSNVKIVSGVYKRTSLGSTEQECGVSKCRILWEGSCYAVLKTASVPCAESSPGGYWRWRWPAPESGWESTVCLQTVSVYDEPCSLSLHSVECKAAFDRRLTPQDWSSNCKTKEVKI